ncbi:MAG TPA: aminoglycoside phosphotransferase family protein [Devosia sp.]|uniref:phosphotransferase family protein n=1 Tax=Devosia sp. TaxID=1871048 RepID=UPI002DDD0D20|nr:aminoglycoside phosphotransferase family protein [Devosia sp.]HEV2517891.1 aminoglycoside phosphotransferase family protein [Devosia sp.]
MRALVIGTLPQFAGGNFVSLTEGWDSVALECDGWIFKFARHAEAEARLRREAALLAFLKPRVTMPLPQMVLHEGPVPFSQHLKLPGASLEKPQYLALDEGRRNALATRMAQLYAELHALPLNRMQAVGAVGVDPWMSPDEIIARTEERLPRGYKGFMKRTVAAYRKLSIAGDELVYGYFDGHGWNMAFDHETGMLNGVFDFADSGFGSRHRDLSYSNWISADLTLRIIDRYEELARVKVNRELVMLYSSALRLAEFAEGFLPDEQATANVVDWVAELKQLGLSQ